MRDIPPALAAHLATGVTTLATCWALTRADGIRMGFTDHDRDIAFDGLSFLARTGFDGTEAVSELGLVVAGGEVAGALSADGIGEADLEAGIYDGARVEIWLVNWADPAQRLLTARSTVGEVKREDGAFSAELRSAAHALNQTQGRLYGKACDADLGDARCGIALAPLAASGTVVGTDGRLRVVAGGLGAVAAGRFDAGRLAWASGANAGRSVEVKRHAVSDAGAVLDLWRPMSEPILAGDAFSITPGCDKRFATCRDTFANALNFRGFPHIPGNDAVLGYAVPGSANDGSSLGWVDAG